MRKLLLALGVCLALTEPASAQLFPSAVLFHPLVRITSPLPAIADISVIADLDSTLSASYGGSGTSWTSLVASPADGTTQAANAFGTGMTFTGTAGQASAYFAANGSTNAALAGTATSYMTALQNDTSSWWIAITFNLGSTAATYLWSTQANSSSPGVSLIMNAGGTPKFNFSQYTTASKQIVSWSPSTTPTTGVEYAVVLSHNQGGNTRVWLNSASNGTESVTTFTAGSQSSTKINVGSRGTSSYMPTGGHLSHFSYGTGYLSNSQAGEIIHLIESRHQVDYDGNGIIGN